MAYLGVVKTGEKYHISMNPPAREHPESTEVGEFAAALCIMMDWYAHDERMRFREPTTSGLSWHEATIVDRLHEILTESVEGGIIGTITRCGSLSVRNPASPAP